MLIKNYNCRTIHLLHFFIFFPGLRNFKFEKKKSFYLKWRTEIKEADLFKVMKAYWRVFHNTPGVNLYRDEQLFLLKRNTKKRLPKRIMPSKVWIFGVVKKKIRFNPRAYEESERFFEQLLIWKDQKLENFLRKYPELTHIPKRHKKIPEYKRPLRV